jgi:riboflavin biosynthesis pyrimidine reductase
VTLEPVELLYEPDSLPAYPLPERLRALYGGSLGFDEQALLVNFVSSLDGIVALPGVPGAVKAIRGDSEPDPFVMGLLRACADALLMGAGTFRVSREARWTAESIYPAEAASFAELRARLGRDPAPELAVATASGRLDPAHPALEEGALVLTTDAGESALRGRIPSASTVVSLGPTLRVRDAVAALRARGHGLLLSEGGPTMAGSLAGAELLDELFLTLSPLLAGRNGGERLSLVQGVELLPGRRVEAQLLGVRRGGSHLFLRYGMTQRPYAPGLRPGA